MGTDASFSTFFNDLWEWDQDTNTWHQKANFGGNARVAAVSFSIGNKGYIGTGGDGTTFYHDFWEYDPSENTGIAEMAKENIFIYPNPATDILIVNFDKINNADLLLNIYNVTGTLVKTEMLKQNNRQINIGDLPYGVYFASIKSNNIRKTEKLLIQR